MVLDNPSDLTTMCDEFMGYFHQTSETQEVERNVIVRYREAEDIFRQRGWCRCFLIVPQRELKSAYPIGR